MNQPRVLYVDDDEDSREMLRMLLELRSIETKAVGTAGEALSSIQAEHFDLYLLDGWLPDLDGFELCRQMRSYDSHTPILFFSGAGREADKKMGHRAGANAYVIKPDISHLLGSIAQFIPSAKAQEASNYWAVVFTYKSLASPDPLAPEPEVTKPRAEGAKDEQQAEGHKKNGKRQNDK